VDNAAMAVPAHPRIYHITHVKSLAHIVVDGGLWSDAVMAEQGGPAAAIGMSTIKLRRLKELQVKCRPGTFVGEYVPFYFCPRSIMLYLIHMANHPELAYRGGQGPIIHFEADLGESVAWAEAQRRVWAFSLSNAGARYTEFRDSLDALGEIDWDAVANPDFRSSEVKEGKQAEFLMHGSFPLDLVGCIGVRSEAVAERVQAALAGVDGAPSVTVRPEWYF
jgi:ssDNA thymidine ADP-ribosyltransferase, DarT